MRAKAILAAGDAAHISSDAPAFTSATQKSSVCPGVLAEDATRRPGAACVVLLVCSTMPEAYAHVIGMP
jgi:hypothetical protein